MYSIQYGDSQIASEASLAQVCAYSPAYLFCYIEVFLVQNRGVRAIC